jgi:hypothetical protein
MITSKQLTKYMTATGKCSIGKCNEVFQPSNDKVPDLQSAKIPMNSNWPKKIFNDDLKDS